MKAQAILLLLILCIVKIDSSAQSWEKLFGGNMIEDGTSVCHTSDNGFIIGGTTTSYGAGIFDFYFVKTDPNGDTLWTNTYGGIYSDKCHSVIQTYDNGYIACGESNSFSNGTKTYVVKTDSAGILLWSKVIGDSNPQSSQSIVQTNDSGFCLTGILSDASTGHSKILIMRLDQSGDTIWSKKYGRDILNLGYSLQQTPDNGFIVSGSSYNVDSSRYEMILIKTDELGDTLWTRYFAGSGATFGHSVITGNNEYIVGGTAGENFFAIAFDLNGNIKWHDEYDKGGLDRCNSIARTTANELLLAGYSIFHGPTDVLILKTDSLGNELWTKLYGGTEDHEAWSIKSIQSGGFIVAGTAENVANNSNDIYVIRSGCDNFPPVEISIQDTICMGDTIASTLISNNATAFGYQWMKDDSIIPGANNSSLIAHHPGLYKLNVYDSIGCSNTSNKIFVEFPLAYFNISPEEACAGDLINFGIWNYPDYYPLYEWDFGDGIMDTGINIMHAYADTGWYNVSRRVVTSNGSCNLFSDSVHITTTAIPPVDFDMRVNGLNMLNTIACPGDTVEFIPYAYTFWFVPLPAFEATTYLWDFGDGDTDTTSHPFHSYSQTGTFYTTFTVTNHCGISNTISDSIKIDNTIVPVSNFSWIDLNGAFNDTVITCVEVLFLASGASTYHWDFGDGTSLSGQDSIYHSYSTAGTYSVELIVSNNCNIQDTITKMITADGICNGIREHEDLSADAIVFPNPFGEEAIIKLPDMLYGLFRNFTLTIFDMEGRIVRNEHVSGNDISIFRNNLFPGIYFFLLSSNGFNSRGKFVIQ